MQTRKQAYEKLQKSRFRSSFHLTKAQKAYVNEKGMDVLRKHAEEMIEKRLAPAVIENDGRQTPMKGHPVFIGQHATATCCRGCLNKWYRVPKNTALTKEQQEKIVNLILYWIENEMHQ